MMIMFFNDTDIYILSLKADVVLCQGNVLRDYLTDLFPILELGTSAKMQLGCWYLLIAEGANVFKSHLREADLQLSYPLVI